MSPAWSRSKVASRPSIDDTAIFTVPLTTANTALPGAPLTNIVVPLAIRRVSATEPNRLICMSCVAPNMVTSPA
jgi:hypothetical protein